MGVKLGGFYGDCAVTLPVGRISADAERLLAVTQDALAQGIAAVRVGGRVSDIGHAVQSHVEAHGYSVVREFVGHGIGAALHEEPQVPNYGPAGRGPRLAEGMVLAIEPMVNMGKAAVKVLADGWTAVTADGSLSAHFEHTVAVTSSGPWILTALPAPAARRGRTPGLRPGERGIRGRTGADVELEGVVEAQLPSALYRCAWRMAGRAAGREASRGRPTGRSRRTWRPVRGGISCGSWWGSECGCGCRRGT